MVLLPLILISQQRTISRSPPDWRPSAGRLSPSRRSRSDHTTGRRRGAPSVPSGHGPSKTKQNLKRSGTATATAPTAHSEPDRAGPTLTTKKCSPAVTGVYFKFAIFQVQN